MIKLLLVDDEPLVLVGLQSMLAWDKMGIEICGTARNGEQAKQIIDSQAPDIVITDIKMPIKTGLELIKECQGMDSLVFIMLTSYEEFSFAKEALHYGAVDYLVKLELNSTNLKAAVERAVQRVEEVRKAHNAQGIAGTASFTQDFTDKFFIRLYNNLFESREQYLLQKAELALDLSSAQYSAVYCVLTGMQSTSLAEDKLMTLYTSTMRIVQDTVQKYVPCIATGLDIRHFNLLLCLDAHSEWEVVAQEALTKAITMVRNYFSVEMQCAVGKPVEDAMLISGSYHAARSLVPSATADSPLVIESKALLQDDKSVFNIGLFRADLTRAFDELDADALRSTITQIAQSFDEHPTRHVQAMDVASSLLYLAITLLPDGEASVEQIFANSPDGYRGLYRLKTAEQCCRWMLQLRDGLCDILQSRTQSYKERLVANVQEYIRNNLGKKLSLNEVAAVFSFSPNYLSQLFAQYSEDGFVGFITDARIAASKQMLTSTDKKIYEISQELGFESAFYFSRVFKKVTGVSPRDYVQSRKTV